METRSEAIIKTGDTFAYAPWGGECTALWVQGELWMAINVHATNGTRVWKTTNGNATKLLHISPQPVAPILWDNVTNLMACMPSDNVIRVWHGADSYDFLRTSPPHESFVATIHDGDLFNYKPWGGLCTARWVNNELWMARDPNSNDGACVWKTIHGDGQRLLRNGVVHLLWDNCARPVAFMPDPDTITVWHDHVTYSFTRDTTAVPIAEPICELSPLPLPFLPLILTLFFMMLFTHSSVTEENIHQVSKHTDVSHTVTSSSPPCESTLVPPVLTLEMAKLICSIAQVRAMELGITIVVSIYDNHGNLKLFERMDNTAWGSIRMSQLKGTTSATFPISTRALSEKSTRFPGNPYASVPDMILLGGGLPIIIRGTHIGSIGVSGATPDMDEQCAQAGINALNNHCNNSEI
jgi:glc operon protein GlcG